MKREHLAFLLGGLAFGFLIGFGVFKVFATRPDAARARGEESIPSPAGPAAPTEVVSGGAMGGAGPAPAGAQAGGGGGGAPMLAEINALKERVTKDPKDAGAWIRLGNLYQDASMYAQAVEFYKRATELRPADANVLTDAGICYQEMKQFDQSLAMFEAAQKADPAHWQSLYNIVIVAGLQMHQFDKAQAALDKLKQVHPDAPNLADLTAALGVARSQAPKPTP